MTSHHDITSELSAYTDLWRSDRKKDRHKTKGDRHKTRNGQPVSPAVTAQKRKFAGIDGEGWGNDGHGRQPYRMILAASEDRIVGALTGPEHLDWSTVLHWMVQLPRDYIYCGYGFGYDVTQILRTLPESCIWSLMHPETRERVNQHGHKYKTMAYTPKVEIDGAFWYFGLEYIPRKQLKVRAWHSENLDQWDHHGPGWSQVKTFVVWDVLSFFQTRFLTAARDSKLFDAEYLDIIEAGKLRRGDDQEHDMAAEVRYCAHECTALARMMSNVNVLCATAGYPLRDFYGAGSVATAMMRVERTKEHTHPVELPREVLVACAYAFFGGRFETRLFGHVGNLWEYDINSAYPFVQSHVPCMVHGTWRWHGPETPTHGILGGTVNIPPGHIGVARVGWQWNKQPPRKPEVRAKWGPFLQRSETNNVHSPPFGTGWYCLNEVDAARRWAEKDGYKLTIHEAWTWHPTCDEHPFSYMASGYDIRKRLKVEGDGRQMVYKLGLNSHSGKADQVVGAAPWHHPFLACWIKAGCRAMLLDAIVLDPDAIAGVATDAVYATRPLPLPTGDRLGEWSEEYKPNAFLFQPGVGWGEDEDSWVKRRGIARLTPELRQSVTEQFVIHGDLTTITVTQPIFYGLARDRERYKLGRWGMLPREIQIGPGDKRYVIGGAPPPVNYEMHEVLTGELTDAEKASMLADRDAKLQAYVPLPCYDTLPKTTFAWDGHYPTLGAAYPKFVRHWNLDGVTAADDSEEGEQRQMAADVDDALTERDEIVDV